MTKELLFVGQEGKVWDLGAGLLFQKLVLTEDEIAQINHFDPKFYVFDKQNGELVHEFPMPMQVTNAPMTYMSGGKQYIVVGMGGITDPAKLVAFALP